MIRSAWQFAFLLVAINPDTRFAELVTPSFNILGPTSSQAEPPITLKRMLLLDRSPSSRGRTIDSDHAAQVT
jgi:hypothetical protein